MTERDRDEWLREMVEEYRRNTEEVLGLSGRLEKLVGELDHLRNDVHLLGATMARLTETLTGGDGQLGMRARQAVLESRFDELNVKITDAMGNGTPHSRAAIGVIQQQLTQNTRDITELRVQREKGISRGWQVAGMIGSALLGLLGTAVAFAALLMKK